MMKLPFIKDSFFLQFVETTMYNAYDVKCPY